MRLYTSLSLSLSVCLSVYLSECPKVPAPTALPLLFAVILQSGNADAPEIEIELQEGKAGRTRASAAGVLSEAACASFSCAATQFQHHESVPRCYLAQVITLYPFNYMRRLPLRDGVSVGSATGQIFREAPWA